MKHHILKHHIAQCTHEAVLLRHGALVESERFIYGQPYPRLPVAQGVCIDDHLIFAMCPKGSAQKPG